MPSVEEPSSNSYHPSLSTGASRRSFQSAISTVDAEKVDIKTPAFPLAEIRPAKSEKDVAASGKPLTSLESIPPQPPSYAPHPSEDIVPSQVKETTGGRNQPSNALTGEGPGNSQSQDRSREDATTYPGARILTLIMTSVYLASFLVALDRTIVSTAIPRITDDFHALNDVGWYGSAYMLTSCAFQLSFGKLYTYYSPKWVLVSAIVLFEIGSAICGAAPNSIVFIVGRAVAGLGSAGIYSGAVIVIVYTVPLRRRPVWTGGLGAVFGVASVAGPLLGGAFTGEVSWRWCFYINLPIGAVTLLILMLFLNVSHPPSSSSDASLRQKILQLDPLGTSLFLPSTICLLLALQWGGTTYAWDSPRIITLLTLFGVLMVGFAFVQASRGFYALLPLHILSQRSILSGTLYSACVGGSMLLFVYYLPLWFQSVKGVSAVQSGIDIIPFLLGLFVASLLAGVLTSLIGYYTPLMIASCCVIAMGAGLLTTFTPDTGHKVWIGYQALYGIGTGLGFQGSNVAAQVVLPIQDVPTGSSLVMFAQSLGGAISVSIGGNVYTNRIVAGLVGVPKLDPEVVINSGATNLRNIVPRQYLSTVVQAYNDGMTATFKVGLAFACASVFGALGMEWISVKKEGSKDRRRGGKVEDGAERKSDGDGGAANGDVRDAGEVTVVDDSRKRSGIDKEVPGQEQMKQEKLSIDEPSRSIDGSVELERPTSSVGAVKGEDTESN